MLSAVSVSPLAMARSALATVILKLWQLMGPNLELILCHLLNKARQHITAVYGTEYIPSLSKCPYKKVWYSIQRDALLWIETLI